MTKTINTEYTSAEYARQTNTVELFGPNSARTVLPQRFESARAADDELLRLGYLVDGWEDSDFYWERTYLYPAAAEASPARSTLNFLKAAYTSPLGIACLVALALILFLAFGVGGGEITQTQSVQ